MDNNNITLPDSPQNFTRKSVRPDKNVSLSSSLVSIIIALVDALIIFGSGIFIFHIYLQEPDALFSLYFSAIAINAGITIIGLYGMGLYNFRSLTRPKSIVGKIILFEAILFGLMLTLAFVSKITGEFSRIWTVSWFLSSLILMIYIRFCYHFILHKLGMTGMITRNIAVIGAEQHGSRLVDIINNQKEPWVHIVGVFEDRFSRAPTKIGASPVLGTVDDLIRYVQENRVDDVIIALPWSAEERMMKIIEKLKVLPVDLRLSPDMIGFNLLNHSFSEYCGLPVLNISDKPTPDWQYIAKILLDKILSTLTLLILSPIMIVIALGIKIGSPGPIFYKQKRYGINNQLIEVLRFRCLQIDMQDRNAESLRIKNDPLVTSLGAFLRHTSLDKLPQFISVLGGEMSIVGPRPQPTRAKIAGKHYRNHVSKYAEQQKILPGITGWAQINGFRGETDTEEKIQKRVEHDLFYINNWSILLDIKIILHTLFGFFTPKSTK